VATMISSNSRPASTFSMASSGWALPRPPSAWTFRRRRAGRSPARRWASASSRRRRAPCGTARRRCSGRARRRSSAPPRSSCGALSAAPDPAGSGSRPRGNYA
jgi:hypothetical protein